MAFKQLIGYSLLTAGLVAAQHGADHGPPSSCNTWAGHTYSDDHGPVCQKALDPKDSSCSQEYDYVIVGGGPAGFVLANQLSEDCRTSVILLEAGSDTSDVETVFIPGFAGNNEFSNQTWDYYVTPQPTLDGATPHLAQGFGFGGGTSVNYMNYNRGAKSVFDEWASISGNDGLRFDNLLNDFKATVTLDTDVIIRNFTQVINDTVYGDGPLSLTRALTLDGFDPSWNVAMLSTLDLPEVDFNDGTGIGVSYGQEVITPDERRRSYAYPAFGVPIANRSNVRFVPNAFVTKVNLNGNLAESVTFSDTADGNATYNVTGKEIILSAGAIQSPKVLMLSGIGPRDHLEAMGIPVEVESPSVGSNLYDHNYGSIEIEVDEQVYTLSEWNNATYLDEITSEWFNQHDGPLANAPASSFAILRVPDDALNSSASDFHRSLPADRGQIQLQYANVQLLPRIDGLVPDEAKDLKIMTLWAALTQPEGSGSVRLNSTDPFAFPNIDTNYFGTSGDLQCVLYGYKQLRAVLQSDTMRPIIKREIFPGPDVTSDEDLIKAIKAGAQSYHHPAGTCALGSVVDSNFRVNGVEGLRVVDASVFPFLPNIHPQASVYAVAHMAARQIKEADGDATS